MTGRGAARVAQIQALSCCFVGYQVLFGVVSLDPPSHLEVMYERVCRF